MGVDFTDKLRALMQYRRISQDTLAPTLGITQSAVSQLLRAKEIKLSQAFALAKLFDVSLDYLADSDLPVRSEAELALDRRIRDLVFRLGPERAYDRLILAERSEMTTQVRPPGLLADGVHGPERPVLEPTHAGHKPNRKAN